jgi:flagellar biosynthesis/type III secretory pathway protein FliH
VAAVGDIMETHGMLRSDSTALFERLREANILLQEVLSGAHENMSAIEQTMATRTSEFVAAMSDLGNKSSVTTDKVEQHLGTFNSVTVKVLGNLGDLSSQFNAHGRSLAEAVELLELSNRRAEETTASRHTSLEALISILDSRTDDFEQRLQRFSGLLDESLDSAMTRTREIASLIAEGSNDSVRSIEQQFDAVRTASEEERKRTSEALATVYDEASSEVNAMFTETAERFSSIMNGMKQMAAEMQQELESTRAELRRGVLELPQETAESAAQMRRVIVDQIEALAELNRIVARHGRSLDAAEPVQRAAEAAYASGGGGARGQVHPIRPDLATPMPPPAMPTPLRDITGAPARRPSPPPQAGTPAQVGAPSGNGRNGGGWLTDLLARASREDSPRLSPGSPPASNDERPVRDTPDALDSLSVDIARMIDHEAAAELWERYRRGERSVFSKRLYTAQGHKAFEEIRNKYRSDPEFRQTVEHYIHEFERLLDDVSRGDRGAAVARNYLTSDTGKVYTMLAHAAGRFDQ